MSARTFVVGACLAAAACSASLTPAGDGRGGGGIGGGGGGRGGGAGTIGLPSNVGDAGNLGSAGTGSGAAGSAGQGGAGGLAACIYSSFSPGANISAEDGSSPRTSLMVAVTVVSSDDCATGVCGSDREARRIVVAEPGGRRWTMNAYYSGLPADIVEVGEALDLQHVFRSIPTGVGNFDSLTIILARGGTAVIFDVSAATDLAPYGITVVSSAIGLCRSDACYSSTGADVTYGTETRSVAPTQTVNIGKLSFTHRGFETRDGPCDSLAYVESMTGFTAR